MGGLSSPSRRTTPAIEVRRGDHIAIPGDCSGEVLSATHRDAYTYVRVVGHPDLRMLEPYAQATITGPLTRART